eukprot:TRINITY_DN3894_c0_g1_i1.p1 TRINITY_DN3894_c0_g1~~TRINITY_DN3894_c0_g1_i1.p1  ORF type:complete len:761 (-),score=55.48 TRINITY_DN3894_c0_g1_i1:693-2975(-)
MPTPQTPLLRHGLRHHLGDSPRRARVSSGAALASVSIILLVVTSRAIFSYTQKCSARWLSSEQSQEETTGRMSATGGLDENERLELNRILKSAGKGSGDLTMTFFCVPKPYVGEVGKAQKQALFSWLRQKPTPYVVLLGQDKSFYELAGSLPDHIQVEPDIDYTFNGLPQLHSLIARSMVVTTNVSVFLEPDILLLGDLQLSLQKVGDSFKRWVVAGMRRDVETFPFRFELAELIGVSEAERLGATRIVNEKGDVVSDAEVTEYVDSVGKLHTGGGGDFWAWSNVLGLPYLCRNPIPPFALDRGRYGNWLLNEMIASGVRDVIDGGDTISAIRVVQSLPEVPAEPEDAVTEEVQDEENVSEDFEWESFANAHLSQFFGSNFTNGLGTSLHAPWRLVTCFDRLGSDVCIVKRRRAAICPCEYSPFVSSSHSDPTLMGGTTWNCGAESSDTDHPIDVAVTKRSMRGLPHKLKHLLPKIAVKKIVVVTGCSFAYRHLLVNFLCTLRSRLGAYKVLVAAFDEDMYKYAFTQGLAVFLAVPPSPRVSPPGIECSHDASLCFAQLTRVKTRVVLRILEAGYNVLWSDPDVVWFANPLPHLASFPSDTVLVQSNEPDMSLPANGVHRANTGFYFAPSSAGVIAAFKEVVRQQDSAKSPRQPDQVAFYSVFCGQDGELRQGDDSCKTDSASLSFLDRSQYLNGRIDSVWKTESVTASCLQHKCFVVHNDALSGVASKISGLMANDLWRYDPATRMCRHQWHHLSLFTS